MKKRSIAEILNNWGKFGVINIIGQWSTLEKGLLVFAIGRAKLEASTDPKVYNLVVDIDHLLNEINDSIQEYLTDTIYNDISDNDLIDLRQEMSGYMETVNVLLRAQFDTIAYLLTGVDNDPPTAEIDGQFARAS
tara:strand:- start:1065 stop:1469 length:405 start_codon:yes stop_codon:yes gene_type:complete